MSQPKTIAFFGSGQMTWQATQDAGYLRGIIRGLCGRGFQVTFFEPHSEAHSDHGDEDGDEPNWTPVTSYRTDSAVCLDGWLEEAAAADIIIESSKDGGCDERLNRSLFSVVRPRTQLVFWDLNPSVTLDRLSANPDDSFRAQIPKYDVILTLGGGTATSDAYMKLGARTCVPISEHCGARELDVILRPASLQPFPA